MSSRYEGLYSQIADALVADGYIVIQEAMMHESLQAIALRAKTTDGYRAAGISSASSRHVNLSRRCDSICWLDESSSEDKLFLDFASGLQEYLNRELFLGFSYYEAHFAKYNAGDFYETHVDAFKNSKNRVVTTVLYLNEDWGDEEGGELVVYNENQEYVTTVKPEANTLVVFMSEKFPHEVKPAKRERYSIAGWF